MQRQSTMRAMEAFMDSEAPLTFTQASPSRRDTSRFVPDYPIVRLAAARSNPFCHVTAEAGTRQINKTSSCSAQVW